jgi:hypothetical protein
MIPVGQPYRPAGTLDAKSILITTILGTTAAVIGAALIWLWEWSPIPTLLLLTPMLQGLGVGIVMAFAIGRLRIRNPRVVAVVAFACGLLSVALVHYGHYLHLVSTIAGELRNEIAEDKSIPEGKRQSLLAQLDTDPARIVDPLLAQQTQHSGFLGSLFLRNAQGVTLRSFVVSGAFLWILWFAEALAAAWIASVCATARAAEPFCEDCGYWCETQPHLFALPGTSAADLVEAVRENDHARIAALRASPFVDNGSGTVAATLHACPGCDQSFADVLHRFLKGKETKEKILLKQHRVSPEVVEAIRTAPVAAKLTSEAFADDDQLTSSEKAEGLAENL